VKVAVLLAGIADPKWPLDPAGAHARILSPFDESALEVALKLRDAHPDTHLTVLLAGNASDEALARSVAAHRIDRLLRVEVPEAQAWDIAVQATAWKHLLADVHADLVLIGREFGDRDDGALPAALAEALGWKFVGLAQEARRVDGVVELLRERGAAEERLARVPPLVASITNDRRNRLRHPLMKNVMAAKRAAIEAVTAPAAPAVRVTLAESHAPVAPARAAACRMLQGSIEEQAAELARVLRRSAEAAS
jgi:electron transfer flavoprotein beta subunit